MRENIKIIPSWLSTNIPSFVAAVNDAVMKNVTDILIIFIVNTARELPGEHWFLVAYDAPTKTMIYYDSVCADLYAHVYKPIQMLAEKHDLLLSLPNTCSQMGNAECGVYSLMKAKLLMNGDNEGLTYIVVPDDSLYEYRHTLQKMLDDSIDR